MARKETKKNQLPALEWNGLTFDSEEERLQFVAQDKLWRFLDGVAMFRDDRHSIALDARTAIFLEAAEYLEIKIREYLEHQASTMDEALGLRRPKGYRRSSAREEHLKMGNLQRTGQTIRNAGAATDEAFFEVLGQIFGLTKTKASELYYRYGHTVDLPPRPKPGLCRLRQEHARFIDELTWLDGYFPRIFEKYGNT